MHVADEVDQVPYSLGALHRVGGFVLQERALLLDRECDTTFSTAIFAERALVFPQRNVNVMPWTVVALIAHIIRPRGRVHHQIGRRVPAPALELRVDGII